MRCTNGSAAPSTPCADRPAPEICTKSCAAIASAIAFPRRRLHSMPMHRLVDIAIGVAIFAGAACPALADAIDGHWCFPDGKRMFIQGPAITTPDGSRIQGEYGR